MTSAPSRARAGCPRSARSRGARLVHLATPRAALLCGFLYAPLLACSNGAEQASAETSGATRTRVDAGAGCTMPDSGSPAPVDGGAPIDSGGPADGGPAPAGQSTGTIAFHLLLGVSGASAPGDSLGLAGDNYTDLIVSNLIAGVMYGHLIEAYTPGIQFNEDYLYGSLFGQLLQENLATQYYESTSSLIDPSPLQQAVMGAGQGGPYQINNYAADMVHGSYEPRGYSLINYVAIQKNIGYSFASAGTQYAQVTPPQFNDKYYGPILTAYFHFNDYAALQKIGPSGGYTPQWEPFYDEALTTFKTVPMGFLDVLLNVAYNQGYYGLLLTRYSQEAATATASTVATVDDYKSVWGVNNTFEQYPYQVRYYLDQLYDNPAPVTGAIPANHLVFTVASLGGVFASVFQTLAYVNGASQYVFISQAQAAAAFQSAVGASGVSAGGTLDVSNAAHRAQMFQVLERAITTLETDLGTQFGATTLTGL